MIKLVAYTGNSYVGGGGWLMIKLHSYYLQAGT